MSEPKDQFLVWHVASDALSEERVAEVTASVGGRIEGLDLPIEPLALGSTFAGASKSVEMESSSAKAPIVKARTCVVLLYGDEVAVRRHLDVAPAGMRKDEAPLLIALESICDLAPRLDEIVLVPVDIHLNQAHRDEFETAVYEVADVTPHHEWLKDLKLLSHLDALPRHLDEWLIAKRHRESGRRYRSRSLIAMAVLFFILGNAIGRSKTEAQPEEVERIRIVPEVVEMTAPPPTDTIALSRIATVRFSEDPVDYGAVLVAADSIGSYWLCPAPVGWLTSPLSWREDSTSFLPKHWRSPRFIGFKQGGTTESVSLAKVRVMAAVGQFLVLYVRDVAAVGPGESALLVKIEHPESGQCVLANNDAEATVRFTTLYPDLFGSQERGD
ncbi:MAG: hypothetical protein K8I27_07000 [Planctomycetes bacterium]|nr:hypothetical protein [Planctomycetota bacterium]